MSVLRQDLYSNGLHLYIAVSHDGRVITDKLSLLHGRLKYITDSFRGKLRKLLVRLYCIVPIKISFKLNIHILDNFILNGKSIPFCVKYFIFEIESIYFRTQKLPHSFM